MSTNPMKYSFEDVVDWVCSKRSDFYGKTGVEPNTIYMSQDIYSCMVTSDFVWTASERKLLGMQVIMLDAYYTDYLEVGLSEES